MMIVAAVLFLFGCFTVIYPIRARGTSRRRHGVFMIVSALVIAMIAAPTPQIRKSLQPSSSVPTFESCRKDPTGCK